eukprot:SAG31_NODE_2781_length_5095_cov_9.452162_7_plen_43_part_01
MLLYDSEMEDFGSDGVVTMVRLTLIGLTAASKVMLLAVAIVVV